MENLVDPKGEVLIEGLKNGQRDAFEKIYKLYWYALYKVVYASLKSHDDTEEIIQELFSNLWEKRDRLNIPHLSNYLFAAARKRVFNFMRSKMVRDRYAEYFNHFNAFEKDLTEEAVQYSDLDQAVSKVMKGLPEKTRQVFTLNRVEGYSIDEISEFLKLPKRTIGYHLTKSIRELRFHLKDFITVLTTICFFF